MQSPPCSRTPHINIASSLAHSVKAVIVTWSAYYWLQHYVSYVYTAHNEELGFQTVGCLGFGKAYNPHLESRGCGYLVIISASWLSDEPWGSNRVTRAAALTTLTFSRGKGKSLTLDALFISRSRPLITRLWRPDRAHYFSLYNAAQLSLTSITVPRLRNGIFYSSDTDAPHRTARFLLTMGFLSLNLIASRDWEGESSGAVTQRLLCWLLLDNVFLTTRMSVE